MPTHNDEPVLAEQQGAVLTLQLNRPDRLNAWTQAMEDRYFDLLGAADDDPDVRAIVVTGAGRGFCAGADLDDLGRLATHIERYEAGRRPKTFPLTIRKPLIGAINGACAGLGLIQALCSRADPHCRPIRPGTRLHRVPAVSLPVTARQRLEAHDSRLRSSHWRGGQF